MSGLYGSIRKHTTLLNIPGRKMANSRLNVKLINQRAKPYISSLVMRWKAIKCIESFDLCTINR